MTGLTKEQALINNARSIGFALSGAACSCGLSNKQISFMTGLSVHRVRKVLSGDELMKLDDISDVAFALGGAELTFKIKRQVKPVRMVAFP